VRAGYGTFRPQQSQSGAGQKRVTATGFQQHGVRYAPGVAPLDQNGAHRPFSPPQPQTGKPMSSAALMRHSPMVAMMSFKEYVAFSPNEAKWLHGVLVARALVPSPNLPMHSTLPMDRVVLSLAHLQGAKAAQ